MAKKKEIKIVKEGGKWKVKEGAKVIAKFGNEDVAKDWVKEHK